MRQGDGSFVPDRGTVFAPRLTGGRCPGNAGEVGRPDLAPWQKNTVHTHTTFCDGAHTPARMAAAALRQGFETLGFSGHSPLPEQDWCMPAPRLPLCRAEIGRLQKKYAGRLEILCGIEWDLRSFALLAEKDLKPGGIPPELAPESWDYWIGSVHMLDDPLTGALRSVDWAPDFSTLLAGYGGDGLALAADYYREMARMAEKKPPVLGHFDLVRKLNAGGRYFDEESRLYKNAALEALAAADPAASVIEINTGGMARGCRAEPYPAQFLLREWRARGGRVTITADAHSANALRYGYTAAAAWARAAGYAELWLLRASGWRRELL